MNATAVSTSRSLHAGRRLRQPVRRGSGYVSAPLKIINSQVIGDELFAAVTFLGDALGLPALKSADSQRTAPIDLNALRRAGSAASAAVKKCSMKMCSSNSRPRMRLVMQASIMAGGPHR